MVFQARLVVLFCFLLVAFFNLLLEGGLAYALDVTGEIQLRTYGAMLLMGAMFFLGVSGPTTTKESTVDRTRSETPGSESASRPSGLDGFESDGGGDAD